MSNTTVYPLDTSVSHPIYEQARADAQARAKTQWETWNFNLWDTYNSTINPAWVDPWYEYETGPVYNGPSTGGDDPAYEQTQNAYYVYCWLRFKGYDAFTIAAMLASFTQESWISGGPWEKYVHPYAGTGQAPYASLVGFDAQSTLSEMSRTWYESGGGLSPAYTCESKYDEYTQTYVGGETFPAGSYNAATHAEHEYYVYFDPQFPDVPYRRVREYASPTRHIGGYGLVQWTPFTKLPTIAEATTTDGSKHWQLNATLHLMILEAQRYQAMNHTSTPYWGEWVNANASAASFTHSGTTYQYGAACTWDDFADGTALANKIAQMAQQYHISMTDSDCLELMVSIWDKCYEKYGYDWSYMETRAKYWLAAVRYWEANGGWDVRDIPRARDIPTCELDNYHINPKILLMLSGRRKRKSVRTILL